MVSDFNRKCAIRVAENKGADQLRGYREADLRLCFRICRLLVFSLDKPAQEKWFSQTIHTYKPDWFAWIVIYYVIFMKHILGVMTSSCWVKVP